VYLPAAVVNPEEIILPSGFAEKAFVWNGSNSKVWCALDANALSYRYRVIQASQIPEPGGGGGNTPPPNTNTPPVAVPIVRPSVDIRFECLGLALEIAKFNSRTEGVITDASLTGFAEKMFAFVNK
jgi:hypothetical protein